MPCITSNASLDVEDLDDSTGAIYFVVVAQGPVTVTFTCDGSIDNISVSPQPPRPLSNTLTFTADNLGQTINVTVEYTPSRVRSAPPLETPTKLPKFKPVTSCPS